MVSATSSGSATSSLLFQLVFGGEASSSSSSLSSSDLAAVRKRLQITVVSAIAISSLATAAGIFGYQRVSRSYKRHDLERNARLAAQGKGKGRAIDADRRSADGTSTPDQRLPSKAPWLIDAESESAGSPRYLSSLEASMPGPDAYRQTQGRKSKFKPKKWDEDLLREQLARNYSFLGEEGMAKIRKSFVIVVGAGGVGSWAALMLLRSGVGKIRIIDFDQVTLSSLNRHACATLADVGRPKVLCCADYFAKIAPWVEIEPMVDVFKPETASHLLEGNPTYVLDAIDNIDAKVALLKHCYEQNLKVFASMGAGGKADPSRVQISDISDTFEDPLAASVRRRLRLLGIPPVPPKELADHLRTDLKTKKKKKEHTQVDKTPDKQKQKTNGHLAAPATESDLPNSTSAATISSKDLSSTPMQRASSSSSGSSLNIPQVPSTPSRPSSISITPERQKYHSRRASSTSSIASGLYATPLSTPRLEAEDQDISQEDATAVPPLDEGTSDAKPAESTGDETVYAPIKNGTSRQDSTISEIKEVEPESEMDKLEITSDGGRGAGAASGPGADAQREFEELRANFMIPCVYSTEKSDVTLLPLPEDEFQKGRVNELSPLEQFRVRILPVLGPLPAMFGLAAATYMMCEIAGHPMEPLPAKRRRKLYEKIYMELDIAERRYPVAKGASTLVSLLFNISDIAYIFEEIFSGKTVVPPYESLNTAQMMRWDSTLPLSFSNVALFSRAQAKVHEKEVLERGKSPYAVWGEGTSRRMRQCQARERYMRELREM